MTTYTATAPDGSQTTRKSDRVYTHAVISQLAHNQKWVAGFAGSLTLANKAADKDRKLTGYFLKTVIVEVQVA